MLRLITADWLSIMLIVLYLVFDRREGIGMVCSHSRILVYSANLAGDQFIQVLVQRKVFAALSCSTVHKQHLYDLGVKNVVEVDIKKKCLTSFPENEFSKVYIFEDELCQCCCLIEAIRKWTIGTIFIITKQKYPQMIYKALGADFVIRTTSDDLSFLLD